MGKILVINEGFSSNLGDQAIKSAVTAIMHDLGFEVEYMFFSNPAITSLPYYNYLATSPHAKNNGQSEIKILSLVKRMIVPFVYSYRMKKDIRTAIEGKQYDYVIIGGGQLINSSKKTTVHFFSIALYWWTKLIKKYSKATISLVGIGSAGNFRKVEFNLYNKSLQRVDNIWARDSFSQESLSKLFHVKTELIPDVAFYNNQPATNTQKSAVALIGIYDYTELKNAFETKFESKEQYYEHWYEKVQYYQQKGLMVKLFYTTLGDAAETQSFRDYILNNHATEITVAPVMSLDDLLEIIRDATCVYSARMHALILALKYNCSVEAFPISQKLVSFVDRYVQQRAAPPAYSKEIFRLFSNYFKSTQISG